jgi:N-carbamoylputrescine amidase
MGEYEKSEEAREMGAEARTLRVAAVQVESQNGQIERNLEHALGFVEHAAQQGARCILLPELLPTGYLMSTDLWEAAEPKEGPTVRWLQKTSAELNVWLGTAFLEADGEDFFITFVLTTPNGQEAGRVRKQKVAVWEAFFTRGGTGPHVIQTAFGKVGVGICYENQLCFLPQLMYGQSVDLLLMPHSDPKPLPSPLSPPKYLHYYDRMLRRAAARSAQVLGVPVVLANKSGPWRSPLPGPFPAQDSIFPGLSAIADSDGTLKDQLGDEEGVVVADVTLDPVRKSHTPPQCQGRWAFEVPWQTKVFALLGTLGHRSYLRNPERKRKARGVSSASP